MRKPKPRQIFITVGSRDDLQLLFHCARTGTPVDWTVPKEAEIGEKVYFVVPSRVGPVRAFGFVDDTPYFSDSFGGTYRTTVIGIELLEVPVPLDEIAKHFKSWPYWGNVKMSCSPFSSPVFR
ncbi:hypothetical protein B1R32_1031 [Abditibacterium utsteinense]|uniref:Uncharacterized protein n=2 Tax=Abditibacterium utsteinense TaxID=1960156 RepID=A0A2S8SVC0_9BACT|nr:hypothetical protein B1R32_1031 [Abditibacterium utsteinense]